MRVLILRHGETDYNVQNRISGRVSAMLTEKGKQQAIEAGVYLQKQNIDYIYISPLQRAIDTYNLLGLEGIPSEIDPRLIEVSFGIFEGQSIETQGFKEVKYHLGYRYPKGETYLEAIHRAYSVLDDLKKKDYQCVLLVCHGAMLRAFNSYFEEMSNDDFFNYRTKNCQINEYIL